ncbi:uncharacterized protein LOC119725300 [Patiria miniata]|uniref:TRADD-like N-terminal domain-containing protein n=1 Tax=Patiria miniata TaxID=46514 RepID=A0A913ZMR0_PATMI|nr:uncharacterized protein LOC119725300 [Patiria miniata]
MSAKLYGTKEGTRDDDQTRNLLETIRGLVEAKEPGMTSLEDICRECDAATVGVEKGCVKVTFRFKSKDGLQRFWAKYSSGELQQRLKADLPIEKVEMSADDYTRGCEFFEGSGRRKQQAQMHSQPDSRLSLDLVQNAIAKYVRHREKTLKVLLAWAQDYANPWAKLTKVIRALVPVLWVIFFLIEVLSWLYQSDESYHEETSVVAVSVIFGVVSQIVTLCMFDLRLSHFYLRSTVLCVVTMASGGFWALSLSVMVRSQ